MASTEQQNPIHPIHHQAVLFQQGKFLSKMTLFYKALQAFTHLSPYSETSYLDIQSDVEKWLVRIRHGFAVQALYWNQNTNA